MYHIENFLSVVLEFSSYRSNLFQKYSEGMVGGQRRQTLVLKCFHGKKGQGNIQTGSKRQGDENTWGKRDFLRRWYQYV